MSMSKSVFGTDVAHCKRTNHSTDKSALVSMFTCASLVTTVGRHSWDMKSRASTSHIDKFGTKSTTHDVTCTILPRALGLLSLSFIYRGGLVAPL
jgi:hypothetical protein